MTGWKPGVGGFMISAAVSTAACAGRGSATTPMIASAANRDQSRRVTVPIVRFLLLIADRPERHGACALVLAARRTGTLGRTSATPEEGLARVGQLFLH